MKCKKSIATRNLHLVTFESAITSGLLSMSIMTPFFYSIGLDNTRIAFSQAIFTAVVLILNLPMGWVADRFSRKWANVIGDFGCALGHLFYSTIHGFWGAVFCECWLGIFLSLSQGVDLALLKHYSEQIDVRPQFFRRRSAKLTFWQHTCSLLLILCGGPLGAINFRLAIALSSVPYFAGGLASLMLHDDSKKLQPTFANPLQDLMRIVRKTFHHPRLRWRIVTYAVGREMTHGIIWILTPMLLFAGVPLAIVSIGWAADSLARIAGAHFATCYGSRLKASQVFAIPLCLMTLGMSILSYRINFFTIGFYFLMGFVCGWTGATLSPLVQELAPSTEQTTIISIAKVMSQALYIPASLVIGRAADLKIHYAPLMTLAIFLPLGLISLYKLQRE